MSFILYRVIRMCRLRFVVALHMIFSMRTTKHQSPRDFIFPLVVLVFLVFCAFFVRVLASNVPGHGPDLGINAGWAHSGVRLGLAQSYREQLYDNLLPNHPPMSIIAYTVMGKFYFQFVSDSSDTSLIANSVWIRLPAILADLVTLVVLFAFLYQWKGWKAAGIGGIVQALQPSVIVDSAIWGQVDSIFSMFLVVSLYAFARKWFVLFAVAYTLAVLSKAQALALAPFIMYLWVAYVPWTYKIRGILAAACVIAVVMAPFVVHDTVDLVWNTYSGAVGYFSQLTMNAYNLWWLLFPNDGGRSSQTEVLGWLTYRNIGLILFGAVVFWSTFQMHLAWWGKKKLPSFLAISYVASVWYVAFFALNTEMHERYLFPAIVLGLPVAFVSMRYAVAYAVLAFAFLLNLVGVLPVSALDRWFFSFESADRVVALSIILCLSFYVLEASSFLRQCAKSKP